MPRIRSIHPDACDSEKLSSLSDSAERTFFRLLTHTDDEGRGEDRPKLLAAKLYPLHDGKDAGTVDADLDELVAVGLLVRYGVSGKRYYAIPTFRDWQNPRHPTASKLPSPDEADQEPDANPTAPNSKPTAKRRKAPAGVGVGVGVGEGGGAIAPPQAAREPDLIFEAITEACGLNLDELTKSARGAANKAAKELREVGASTEGIYARAVLYRQKWPEAELTPSALAKNYAQLGARNGTARASPRSDECHECRQPLEGHDQQLHDMLVKAG